MKWDSSGCGRSNPKRAQRRRDCSSPEDAHRELRPVLSRWMSSDKGNKSRSTASSTSTTSVLVLTSDDARTKAAGDALKAKLGVKGGGRGVRWSGKWTGVWKEAKENTLVEEILQNLL